MRAILLSFLMIGVSSLASAGDFWPKESDQHWSMYPMMNANDPNKELGKNESYNPDLIAAVTDYCTWAKGELPVMIWGVRTFDSKTKHERIFECAKYINPTN